MYVQLTSPGDPDPTNPDHEDVVLEGKHLIESGRRHAVPDNTDAGVS